MGLLKKLFGGESKKESNKITVEDIQDIISAYGTVLETQAPTHGCVADVSKLPYPKDVIKTALKTGIQITDNKPMRDTLIAAYPMLADFQEGVGPDDVGFDARTIDTSDMNKVMEQFSNQKETADKWVTMAKTERKELRQELIDLGY